MRKFMKISAVALTLVMGVSGGLPGLNTTIQAHATSYSGYTQPTYHVVASYHIDKASVKQMAKTMRAMTGGNAGEIESLIADLGPYARATTVAVQLAANAQSRKSVLYAADHNMRVICSIKDASVHTSYSTIVTFSPVK